MIENQFLSQLLRYEQDGKSAVSSPSNWNEKPLLEVKTEVDLIVEEISSELVLNDDTARWHFFIGSPGNGKSAAVGRLYRLLQSKGIVFKTKDKNLYSPSSNDLPYVLYAYKPNQNHSFAYFTQDASVVEDPYAVEISPARDMLDLIKEAWHKRKCLIICANRGIIEEAIRIGEEVEEYRNEEWFKKVVLKIYKNESSEIVIETDKIKQSTYSRFKFSYSTLDFRSIVLNKQGGENIFNQLIIQAVNREEWDSCNECECENLCPFKKNRDYLFDEGCREKIVKLIKRVELYSGQVIVFREALALLSLILAGCSDDLIKTADISPCEWVRKKVKNDESFDLLGRRIYMTLFSSFSPYGFDFCNSVNYKENITKVQKKALLNDSTITKSKIVFQRLFDNYNTSWLSLNVGLGRIIGEKGVLKDLHPIHGIPLNNYENQIQEQWEKQLETLIGNTGHNLITEIEKAVFLKFKELEDAVLTSNDNVSYKLSWLSRWITSITYNIGVLDTCKTNFDNELDQLVQAFEKPNSEEYRRIKKLLKDSVKKIFDEENNRKISITKNMAVIDFDIKNLAIEVPIDENKTYGLEMRFETNSPVTISIQAYCWLIRKLSSKLSSATFPKEFLDTLKVFQIKAVKDLKYNTKPEVELSIRTSSGNEYKIIREEGLIDVLNNEMK